MSRSLKIVDDARFDDIRVASPCHAEWSDMVGSDSVRFCASCQKNVFNLSNMQRDEAIELLRATEGKVCVRFYRRADGTVLTEDCPVGIRLAVKRAKKMTLAAAAVSAAAVAAVIAFLGGSFLSKKVMPEEHVMGEVAAMPPPVEEPPPPPPVDVVMGQAIAPLPQQDHVVEMGEPMPPTTTKPQKRLPPRGKKLPPIPAPQEMPPPVKTMGLVVLPTQAPPATDAK